ncbi:potassium-transporting ATPase subunit KdpC [Paenibacillus marinisediminis]
MKTTDINSSETERGAGSLSTIIRMSFGLLVLCGLIYPLVMTGVVQAAFPKKAEGSIVYDAEGRAVGSELIGQTFTEPYYFHGRVSSIAYDAGGAGSPNYAPSNPELAARIQQSVADWQANNPDSPAVVPPADLITNSGSGLDPHISPASAAAQIPRVAEASGISEEQLAELVKKHTQSPELGIFGEPRVNVLLLNLDLQQAMKESQS